MRNTGARAPRASALPTPPTSLLPAAWLPPSPLVCAPAALLPHPGCPLPALFALGRPRASVCTAPTNEAALHATKQQKSRGTLQCSARMYRLHVQAYRQHPGLLPPHLSPALSIEPAASCRPAVLPFPSCFAPSYAPPLQPSCPCRSLVPCRACPAAACTLLAPCPCLAVMDGSCSPFPPFQAGPSTNPCQPPLTQLERRHTPDRQPHHTYLSATRMVVIPLPPHSQRTTSLSLSNLIERANNTSTPPASPASRPSRLARLHCLHPTAANH